MSCTDPGLSLYLDQPVGSGKTGLITFYILDEAGANLPLVDLQSIRVTLTDYATGAVINGRSAQSLLNTNGGIVETVTVDGVTRLRVRFLLTALDNVILDSDPDVTREAHVGAFTWDYDSDRIGGLDATFVVVRL